MQVSEILLLSGNSGVGKSMILKTLLSEFDSAGIRSGGILAPGRYLDSGIKEFDIELVPGNEKYFLSSRIENPEWKKIGSFWFNPPAIELGLNHLLSLKDKQYQLYLLDEIGPFELDGMLWSKSIPILLDQGIPLICTVRNSLIARVCSKWNIKDPCIIRVHDKEWEKPMEDIRIWIKQNIQESF